MNKAAVQFASANKFTTDYNKDKTVSGIYGYYNLLNVSFLDGEKGTVVTIHNEFKRIDALEADLKRFGFIESVTTNKRDNIVIKTMDRKYSLKEEDFKWILDTVLDFVKKFNLRIGNCESCGRAGAKFFKDTKTGEYFHICENCFKNVRSDFNKDRGEKTGFWAALGRLFRRRKKTHKHLVDAEANSEKGKKK